METKENKNNPQFFFVQSRSFWYSIKRGLTWPMRPKAENNFLIKWIFLKFLKNNCDIKVPIHACQLYKSVRRCILRNGMTQLLCDSYLPKCRKSWRLPSSRLKSTQHLGTLLSHYLFSSESWKKYRIFLCIHFIISTL